jgi:hypothetical protein
MRSRFAEIEPPSASGRPSRVHRRRRRSVTGVSRPVELADVAEHLDVYGPLATLVTVGGDATPHVGTVVVTVGAAALGVRVGARTRDNIRANPSVTLAWLQDERDYQLIVDGVAVVVDDPDGDGLYPVEIDVRRGILHRLAGRTAGPSCRSLGTAAASDDVRR